MIGRLIALCLFFSVCAEKSQSEIVYDPASPIPSVALSKRLLEGAETQKNRTESEIVVDIDGMTTKKRVDALRNLSSLRSSIVSLSDRIDVSTDALRDDLGLLRDKLESIKQDKESFSDGELDFLTNNLADADEILNNIVSHQNSKPKPGASDAEKAAYQNAATELLDSASRLNERLPVRRIAPDEVLSIEDQLSSLIYTIKSAKSRREFIKTKIDSLNLELKTNEENQLVIAQQIELASSARNELGATLSRLDTYGTTLLQAKLDNADYTRLATLVFGGLVASVIGGFFAVAFLTDDVRGVMFGGDRGIQFITLFSLVIAIILFGILGILEGKELSALLGGLSGYILGRGTQGAEAAKEDTPKGEKSKDAKSDVPSLEPAK